MHGLIAAEDGFVLSLQKSAQEDIWILSWSTQPGAQYTLQKSANLAAWADVLTLTAESNVITQTDTGLTNQQKTFWRVLRLGGDTNAISVSTVVASYELAAGASRAMLRVLTSGTQTVSSVVFLDSGVLLGDAAPGIGDAWSFNLVWDGVTRQTRRIVARVTTEEGTTVDSETRAFLLEDPGRFVPMNPAGGLALGEFVSVDAGGNLGPFILYPEGFGDGIFITGAHIEFPAGATLTGDGVIQFNVATFHRGHKDDASLPATPGTHTIDPDAVTPSVIANSFGPADLLWSFVPLRWTDGALGPEGWGALNIEPPVGFLLPERQQCALVSVEPESGEPALVICYYGQWGPFGPVRFRIPSTDPLKIYITLSGRIAAEATVEAIFDHGPQVRGTVAWRDPAFEFRFQGRNITIPALASLKRALPENPDLCIPLVATSAELDAAAKCLASFRETYRALAIGGAAQAPLASTETFVPLPAATDSAGAALSAWASRLASWSADRPGQLLDDQMLSDLRKVVSDAARTGEAAHHLPTVLKLLKDVLLATRHFPAASTGIGAGEIAGLLGGAQERLFAAAERILGETAGYEPSAEFAEIVRLLKGLTADNVPLAGRGGVFGIHDATSRLQQVLELVKTKVGPNFAFRVFEAAANRGLSTLTAAQVLAFLEEMSVYSQLLEFTTAVPPGSPTADHIRQATLRASTRFESVHDANTASAIASGKYEELRIAVADRARFFDLRARLGLIVPSNHDGFFRTTTGLIEVFAPALRDVPVRTRAEFCRADWAAVDMIANSTTDHGANSVLEPALTLLNSCNDLLTASMSNDKRCNDLLQFIQARNIFIAPRPTLEEGTSFPDISGRYDSVNAGSEAYLTLQINQGGRFFQGILQGQNVRSDRTTARQAHKKIEGWFLQQSSQPGVMEFACRVVDTATGATDLLRGSSLRNADLSTSLVLGGVQFVQTTDRPAFSDNIIGVFEKEQRDAIRAAHENPIHRQTLSRIAAESRGLRLIIERFWGDSASQEQEIEEALNLNERLLKISRMVAAQQQPMARLAVRQILASSSKDVLKSKVAGIQIIGGRITRSHWELALGMAFKYPNLLDQAPAMLGVAPAEITSVDHYKYKITIQQVGVAPVKAFIGATELDVTIEKTAPDGTSEPPYRYDGHIGTVGVSAGAGLTVQDTVREIESPFNYGPADFVGELKFTQIAAGFAFADLGLGIGTAVLQITGSGRLPPVYILPSISDVIDGQKGLGAQAGWDVGAGMLVEEGTNPEARPSLLFDDIVTFQAESSARFDQAVFFDVDSDVISACGLQFLREFVAENRSLFESPSSFIEVHGFTDRTATNAYNLDLSQRRAAAVMTTLIGFVGIDFRIVPENLLAVGHGEEPAAQAGVPDAPNPAADNPFWRRVDVIIGGRIMVRIPTPAGRVTQ